MAAVRDSLIRNEFNRSELNVYSSFTSYIIQKVGNCNQLHYEE